MRLIIFALTAALVFAQAPTKQGKVERIKVHGLSLEGNLEGDSPDREVSIYLPPSYANEPDRRYPVVYLLHGYTSTDLRWFGKDAAYKGEVGMDHALAAGTAKEMILVMPNAYTVYQGSMYSNSPVSGDWEGFIVNDLVSYVDSHYRTIAKAESRGLGGHSMGGYGGARIAMKYPYVFSAVYLQSSCCLGANVNMRPEQFAAFDSIKTLDDLAKAGRGPNTLVAEAAAWSPNPKNPPFFVDLPVKDGKVQPSVVAKWAANAPLAMVDQYLGNLKKLKALGLEVGLQDSLIGSNKQLDETLSLFAVPHTFETYEGDHTNRIAERTEKNMLPFFTRHLQFQ